ncbi:hypothetical protein GCM10027431_28070 [Lysobacter rhizosphaerae]
MSTLLMLAVAVALVAVVWRASHGGRNGRISGTNDAASGTPYADGSDTGPGTSFGDDASSGSDCADSGSSDSGGCDGGGDGGGGD